ncbi:MAG: alpha-L-fucosidase [Candidatus Abyssubacteria bacterium]
MPYEPTWKSLDSRPCPAWYDEAKFGIFVHWGVYSVPAWDVKGSYTEWYWFWLAGGWNAILNRESAIPEFHAKTYGKDFKYQDFAPLFKAELFDPDQWADLFAKSGARYVVLTSKHHDGFCLWPSPHSWNWNSMDIGPKRDLVDDLTRAVRARGLKMGFYYSLYEWFNPFYMYQPTRYVDEHMIPQFKDLVQRYQPSLIFSDGEWDHPSTLWRSRELLAWLFNKSACRKDVVVNDRWGRETRSKHGGYFTSEFGEGGDVCQNQKLKLSHKWEENRGMGASFGFNRNESIFEYRTSTELIHILINTVSMNGNLLLNIGPTADGRIPVIMQERLMDIGRWLEVNGESIYGTRPWTETAEGEHIRYTCRGNTLYAICLKWPKEELVLRAPTPTEATEIRMLGCEQPLNWQYADGALRIETPSLSIDEMPCHHAYVFKIE